MTTPRADLGMSTVWRGLKELLVSAVGNLSSSTNTKACPAVTRGIAVVRGVHSEAEFELVM